MEPKPNKRCESEDSWLLGQPKYRRKHHNNIFPVEHAFASLDKTYKILPNVKPHRKTLIANRVPTANISPGSPEPGRLKKPTTSRITFVLCNGRLLPMVNPYQTSPSGEITIDIAIQLLGQPSPVAQLGCLFCALTSLYMQSHQLP